MVDVACRAPDGHFATEHDVQDRPAPPERDVVAAVGSERRSAGVEPVDRSRSERDFPTPIKREYPPVTAVEVPLILVVDVVTGGQSQDLDNGAVDGSVEHKVAESRAAAEVDPVAVSDGVLGGDGAAR
jgi:hypothetical protein